MPALLELRMAAGDAQRITIPVEAWRQSNTLSIDVPVSGDVKEVVLDPDHKLPLSDRMAVRLRSGSERFAGAPTRPWNRDDPGFALTGPEIEEDRRDQ